MRKKYPHLMFFIAVLMQLGLSPNSVFSQAPFYQGKTLKIINNDPGGTAGMRVKTVVPYLRKYIPGNPTIVVEFIEGGGGRRAANHVFRTVNPDGLVEMDPLEHAHDRPGPRVAARFHRDARAGGGDQGVRQPVPR